MLNPHRASGAGVRVVEAVKSRGPAPGRTAGAPARPDHPHLPVTIGNRAMGYLLLRSACACGGACEECRTRDVENVATIQRRGGSGRAETDAAALRLLLRQSQGHGLNVGIRGWLESIFGVGLSRVRVHGDHAAAAAASRVAAEAFTTGQDIYFGSGRYQPDTEVGRRLLAHEVTHTLQQGDGGVPSWGSISVNRPDDPYEREADRAADQAQAAYPGGTLPAEPRTIRSPAGPHIPSVGRPRRAVLQRKDGEDKVRHRHGLKVTERADGGREVEVVQAWQPEGGTDSTVIAMAAAAGISVDVLSKALVDTGAYATVEQVAEGFIVGTRIVVRNGAIVEISVRGKVVEAAGKPKPSFDFFLEEGAEILGKAGFGLCAGSPDEQAGFDASAWLPDPRRLSVIRASISPWRAMEKLVRNIGKDVRKRGGGTTQWKFECAEFVRLLRIYAYWRTMTESEFNKRFAPLELGALARGGGLWEQREYRSDRPGGAPYYYEGGEQVGPLLMGAKEVPAGKSWAELLDQAPVGAYITWTNLDARNKCSANPRLDFCDDQNENATKLGPDRYYVHDLGVLNEKGIKQAMVEAVFGDAAKAPPDYTDRYIYIASLQSPRP